MDGIVKVITAWEIEVEESKKSTMRNQLSQINEQTSSQVVTPINRRESNFQSVERHSTLNSGIQSLSNYTPIRNRGSTIMPSNFSPIREPHNFPRATSLAFHENPAIEVQAKAKTDPAPAPVNHELQPPLGTMTISDLMSTPIKTDLREPSVIIKEQPSGILLSEEIAKNNLGNMVNGQLHQSHLSSESISMKEGYFPRYLSP